MKVNLRFGFDSVAREKLQFGFSVKFPARVVKTRPVLGKPFLRETLRHRGKAAVNLRYSCTGLVLEEPSPYEIRAGYSKLRRFCMFLAPNLPGKSLSRTKRASTHLCVKYVPVKASA